MVFQNDILAGSSGGTGTSSAVYKIDQSIRFNKDDTPYMTRTPSGAGNTKKWTLSWWEKRGRNVSVTNGNEYTFHTSPSGANNASYIYNYNNHPYYWEAGNTYIATRKLRDPSSWYNNVVVYDSANPVALERIKLFINGTRITDFSTYGGITLNQDSYWNSATAHYISNTSSSSCIDGYLAEIVFIDGQALDPSSFAETNNSGIWIPKDVSGLTFGTNGFHIKGESASDLGNDSSGNNNDFTTSGLSSDDQQPDSPTNNHCTWNPIEAETLITYSNGNLAIAYSGSSGRNAGRSTIKIPASTDAFFEMVMTSNLGSGVDFFIGIEDGTAQSDNINSIYNNAYIIREDGSFLDQSSRDYSYGTSFTNTDVLGVWRKANGDLVFYKNGTAMNSGTPAKTGLTGTMFFVAGAFNGSSAEARFASSKWTNKPSGVTDSMALNTKNLGG